MMMFLLFTYHTHTHTHTQKRARQSFERFAAGQNSDHIALLNAFNGWASAFSSGGRKAGEAYCRKNFLSTQTMYTLKGMKRQLAQSLNEIGFDLRSKNSTGKRLSVVKSIVATALYPNVATRCGGKNFSWQKEKKLRIHRNSINKDLKANVGGDARSGEVFQFLAFETCTRAQHGVYMENTSLVSPTSVVLLSADLALSLSNTTNDDEEEDSNIRNRSAFLVLRLNPYISIHVEAQNAVLFRLLRT